MRDGCKVHMEFLHGIKWIMFHGHLDYFQKPSLEGRLNTKTVDHGDLNVHIMRENPHEYKFIEMAFA